MPAALVLLVALACGGKDSKPAPAGPAPGGKKTAPAACDGLPADLAAAAQGDTSKVDVDADGRVQVALELGGGAVLPNYFLVEAQAMGHAQGRVKPDELCELAATKGIIRVRTPRKASPK